MKNKIYTILLSLAIVVTMMPSLSLTAYAASKWKKGDVQSGQVIDVNTIELSGVYTVNGNVNNNHRLEVRDSATITLESGCVLNIPRGIHVKAGCSLIIEGDGTLNIKGVPQDCAGIGGNIEESCGTVTITGGTVTVIGGRLAAGIGGGRGNNVSKRLGNGGDVIIEGGHITATGGVDGAGIGGGCVGHGGNVTISGGTVIATGGDGGAGIGAGLGNRSLSINGGTVTITGGTVVANGGRLGAGIGGGAAGGDGAIVRISNGNITATGGRQGAGIGGGNFGKGGEVTITGGIVTATGGLWGAGIGGGNGSFGSYGDGGNVTISGGHVTATGGELGAGIGGGRNGAGGNLTVNGGNIVANGGVRSPSIGRGDESINKSMGTFTLRREWGVFDISNPDKVTKIDNPTPRVLDRIRKVSISDSSHVVDNPKVRSNIIYNGREQNALDNTDKNVIITGTTKATNAGSYSFKATLKQGYLWTDLTDKPKTITWKIEPKDVSDTRKSEYQNVVEGTGDFIEPTFYDRESGDNITGTLVYKYELKSMPKDSIKEELRKLPVGSRRIINWEYNANKNFKGTISGSILLTVVGIEFKVNGQVADATNAIIVRKQPVYGDNWDNILTIRSNRIVATLNGVRGDGEYSLNVSGRPNAGEQEYTVQFDGSFNGVHYSNINVLTGKVNVAKAKYTNVIKTASGKVKAEKGQSVLINLPNIPMHAKYGTPIKNVMSDPYRLLEITENWIPVLLTETPQNTEPMYFTVPVIPDNNHIGYDITVTVKPEKDFNGFDVKVTVTRNRGLIPVYIATITADPEEQVDRISHSMTGLIYTPGSRIISLTDIKNFYIRIRDKNGKYYYYSYEDGEVKKIS